jgi:hypothetical protein
MGDMLLAGLKGFIISLMYILAIETYLEQDHE